MSNNVLVSCADNHHAGLFCRRALIALIVASLFSSLVAMPASAELTALRVNAPIVAVEAVTRNAPAVCDQPAPAQSEGLAAALRWDLYGRCRRDERAAVVTGYRVEYEWDGQRFSTVLQSQPTGDTIPLTLHID